MKYFIFYLLSLVSVGLFAADTTFTTDLSTYFYYKQSEIQDSFINPDMLLSTKTIKTLYLDQRFDFGVVSDQYKLLFRSQALWAPKSNSDHEFKFQIFDLFYEQKFNSEYIGTIGLQTYEWGPSEFLNPSNPFFNLQKNQSSLYFKNKGKNLLRLNWSSSREYAAALIVEPISNNEPLKGQKAFTPQGVIKFEKSSLKTNSYIGGVLGKEHFSDFFLGQYGQLQFDDMFSVYLDSRQTIGSQYLVPIDLDGQIFLKNYKEDKVSSLSIFGLRFEDEFDFRFEYIYNSLGYSGEQMSELKNSVSMANPEARNNLAVFNHFELDFLTKNYILMTLRKISFLNTQDFNLTFRSITSLSDYSGFEQINIERSQSQATNSFIEATIFRGDKDTEFRLFNRWSLGLGLKILYD